MSKRPYKPTALKVLEGKRGHRPLPANEVKPRPITPKMPSGIDPGARAVWRKLSKVLERAGLLTEADGQMLGAICQAQSILQTLYRTLAMTDRQIKNAAGEALFELEDQRARLWKEIRLQQANFRLLASEFGLTPRGRVGLVIKTDKSDDDELLLTQVPK